jgi:UDP-N-acetylglucosamine 1-carboxyvinyltransferase
MATVQYVVEGGRRLSGEIRPSGNKNAALPIIAAALLTEQPVTLHNVPRIRDTETLVELLRSVGAAAAWHGDNELRIHAHTVRTAELDARLCARIRASILLAAPVLARCGEVVLPPPGGDVIGRRRVDTHFHVLERLGATVDAGAQFSFRAKELRGADIFLDEPSVTATENALMAAAAAQGTTVLRNAASEPHVQDLARFLGALGVRIDGIGSNVMTIEGGASLGSATHAIGPDHIEVGSFIGLAAVTRSALRIEAAGVEHLASTLMGFDRLGVQVRVDGDALEIPGDQSPRIKSDLGGHVPTLADQPWPAFPADLMSIAIVTATQCEGLVLMHEKMFESRLFFVDKLISMGARIVLCDPHRALVAGPTALRPGRVSSPDIRAGMAMLLAALSADGRSVIEHAEQIERGYERIDQRLNGLGARITRTTEGA